MDEFFHDDGEVFPTVAVVCFDNVVDRGQALADGRLIAAAPLLLQLARNIASIPKHGEPDPSDPNYTQDWQEELGRYAIGALHNAVDDARETLERLGVS